MRGNCINDGAYLAGRRRLLIPIVPQTHEDNPASSRSEQRVPSSRSNILERNREAHDGHGTTPSNQALSHVQSALFSSSKSGSQEAPKHHTLQTKRPTQASASSRKYEDKPQDVSRPRAINKKPSSTKPLPGTITLTNSERRNKQTHNARGLIPSVPKRKFESYDNDETLEILPEWQRSPFQQSLPNVRVPTTTSFQDVSSLIGIPATQIHLDVLSLEICQEDFTTLLTSVTTVFDSSCSNTIITQSRARQLGLIILPSPPSHPFERIATPHGYFDPEEFVMVTARIQWLGKTIYTTWSIAVVPDDFQRPEGADLIVGAKMLQAMQIEGVGKSLCDLIDVQQRRLRVAYPWSSSDPLIDKRGRLSEMRGPVPQEAGDASLLNPNSYPPGQPSASSVHSGVASYTSTDAARKTNTPTTSVSAMPPSRLPKPAMTDSNAYGVDKPSGFNAVDRGQDQQVYQHPVVHNGHFPGHKAPFEGAMQASLDQFLIYDGGAASGPAGISTQPAYRNLEETLSLPATVNSPYNASPQAAPDFTTFGWGPAGYHSKWDSGDGQQ